MAVKSTKESHDRSCDEDEYLPEKPQEPLSTDCCGSGNQTRYKFNTISLSMHISLQDVRHV